MRYLLDRYPCMQLVDATPRLGGPGLRGSEREVSRRTPPARARLLPQYTQG